MKNVIENLILAIKSDPNFKLRSIGSDIPMPVGSTYEFDLSQNGCTYQNMGATIIDSILQAGVNYNSTVKPRVTKFRKDYSETKTTSDFYKLISNQSLNNIINWNGQKVDRIIEITRFLLKEGVEDEFQLKEWLQDTKNVERLSEVKGVKEKTIDYLKILSGDTTIVAMDVHLQNFIKIYGGLEKTLDYKSGQAILITLAEKFGIDPATLDHSIWYFMSKK